MEELDLLKKDWKKNADRFPKVSENEIYGMLHKKSSSVVKWILLISIIEFAILLSLSFLLNGNAGTRRIESYLSQGTLMAISIGDYAIMVYFMVMFYINYRKISTTDQVKNLMANILRTRKTVSTYIFVKIAFIIACFAIMFVAYFNNDPELISLLEKSEQNGKSGLVYFIYIGITVVCIAIFVFIVWLFYRIIYGLLLKSLRRNYDELKKIDL